MTNLNLVPDKILAEVRTGNIKILREFLEENLEALKDDLVDIPMEKVEECRGSVKTLRFIIKLLAE